MTYEAWNIIEPMREGESGPERFQRYLDYEHEANKAFQRGDQWSASEIKKALDHWSEHVALTPREMSKSKATCTCADPVYTWKRYDSPSAESIKLRAEEAKTIMREMLDRRFSHLVKDAFTPKEKKMETKYEYKVADHANLTPENIAKHSPSEKEFGRYSLWYFGSKRGMFKTEQNLAAIVEKGETVWLDWLVSKGLVERTEKKRKLTIEDMQLSTCHEGVALRVGSKTVLIFEPDGCVQRVLSAQTPFIPVDKDGKIIIR